MKYVCLFLAVLILCCCFTPKKGTQPPANPAEDTLLAIPETILENSSVEDDNTTQYYSYSYRSGSSVIYYGANDLNFLLADTTIKSLRLSGGTFQDLSPLAGLTELEELDISGNQYITDISPIGFLINLRKLILGNGRVESIEPISALTNLRYLQLWNNDGFYKELVPLQKLEHLVLISESKERWDAGYIAQLHSLKELYIDTGPITNIELLKNLVNLEKLNIASSGLDISWITHLQNLRELELRVNRITDIRPLLELPNLVDVDLYKTVVRDISPLLESRSIKKISGFVLENDTGELDLYSLFWDRGIEFTPYFSDR